MTTISNRYDVILTYSPIIEITGHIFECFDYYLFLRQYCKAGILFFCSLNKEKLKVAFESKYTVPFADIEQDFITIDSYSRTSGKQIVSFGKNTTVIITDGNLNSFECNNIYLSARKLYGFLCDSKNSYPTTRFNNHIIYLQDYRIYGENKQFKSIDYIKKLPFKFYKKFHKEYDNSGMMYMTYICRKVTPDIIELYFKKSKCSTAMLVVPYTLPEYDNIAGVKQVVAPVTDFFNKFDKYIYTPVARHFDCSPRLVTECFLQRKEVMLDLDYHDIGLETRYSDCVTNLESLNLTDSDLILSLLK